MYLYAALAVSCIVVLIILITSSTKTQLVSDPSYMFAKIRLTLGTIALGYMIVFLSNGDITRNFQVLPSDPKIPGSNLLPKPSNKGLLDYVDESTDGTLSLIFQTAGFIWFIAAISLIPFGHSPYDIDSSATEKYSREDKNMTQTLERIYRFVYIYPFRLFSVIFAVTLSLFVIRSFNGLFFDRSTVPSLSISSVKGVPGPYFTTKDDSLM